MVKWYLVIAACVAGLCAAVVYFDGPGGATEGMFSGMANNARPFLGGTITNFIFEPLIFAFTSYIGAVGAGFLWPLLVIWFFLLLIALGATVLGPTISELSTVG